MTMEQLKLPLFDSAALSSLSAKINEKTQQGGQKATARNGRVVDRASSKKPPKISGDKSTEKKSVKRGTKRDVRGKAKTETNRESREEKQEADAPNDAQPEEHDDNSLLQEIIALDGTKQDLDLVADAVSDDGSIEAWGGPAEPISKDLQQQLAQFSAGLGFDAMANEDTATSSEDEKEAKPDVKKPETKKAKREEMKEAALTASSKSPKESIKPVEIAKGQLVSVICEQHREIDI